MPFRTPVFASARGRVSEIARQMLWNGARTRRSKSRLVAPLYIWQSLDALRHVILTFVDRAVSWWQSSSLWRAVPQQMAV
jgi:hypothetical protein